MLGDPVSGAAEQARDDRQDAAERIAHAGGTRKLRAGCLVSIFTLAGLTLGAEVVLRVSDDRLDAFLAGVQGARPRWLALLESGIFEEVDDDVRRYAMRPGVDADVGGFRFRVSAHRSRGMDFPAAKPADERRLLMLGDSFCFGMWADEDATLSAHLAALANDAEAASGSGLTWRAVNLGVPGYHSEQQARAFEADGLALSPDVVVLYYNTNDIAAEGFFLDEDLAVLRSDHLPLPAGLKRALWSSHLYGFIVRRYERTFRDVPDPNMDPRVPWAHTREDTQRTTRDAIARIAARCRERDVPLFFVNQPLMSWSGDARSPEWSVLPLVDWAEDVRAEVDVPGINLLGWMRGYADGVDRLGTGAPQEFLPDVYFADERVQAVVDAAKRLARDAGLDWDALELLERVPLLERAGVADVPEEPDFHLTGEGYAHMARIVYASMKDAGLVP